MRTLLIFAIVTLGTFTAIGLLCAVRIGLRRSPAQADPFSRPFGEMPGFTAEQLRAISRHSMTRIEQDAQRRSFAYGNTHLSNPRITREMVDRAAMRIPMPEFESAGVALRPDAGGGRPSVPSAFAVARNFFRGASHHE